MSEFKKFSKFHKPIDACQIVPVDIINRFRGRLPSKLLQFWQETGWCGYSKGFLWTFDPNKLADVLQEFLPDFNNYVPIPFLRTAFGDIIYWHDQMAYYMDVHFYRVFEMTSDMEILFENTLTTESFLDIAMGRPMFNEVYLRLGPVASDECYAFVPPLVLGGEATVDSVTKVKLREQLSFLSQLDSISDF